MVTVFIMSLVRKGQSAILKDVVIGGNRLSFLGENVRQI